MTTLTYYARVVGGIVAEPPIPLDSIVVLADVFSAETVEQLAAIPATQVGQVGEGWTYAAGVFSAPVPVAPTQAQLIAYAGAKVTAILANPRSYTIDSGITIKADATTPTIGLVNGLGSWGTANPTATTMWTDDCGTVTQITGTEAVSLYTQGLAYIQSVYQMLGTVVTAINGGTVTTYAQIDAEAWPV